MVLLTEVKSTSDKGLIGITEKGEEIPLSSPFPRSLPVAEYHGSKKGLIARLMKTARTDSSKYYQINKESDDDSGGAIAIAYNIYVRRSIESIARLMNQINDRRRRRPLLFPEGR